MDITTLAEVVSLGVAAMGYLMHRLYAAQLRQHKEEIEHWQDKCRQLGGV